MTYDDDFLQFEPPGEPVRRVTCKGAGISWPPPKRVHLEGVEWQLDTMSQLTDAERADMGFIARGARYVPAPAKTPEGATLQ